MALQHCVLTSANVMPGNRPGIIVNQTLSNDFFCLKGHDRDIRIVYSSGTSTEEGCLVTNQTDRSALSHSVGKTMRDSRVSQHARAEKAARQAAARYLQSTSTC
jgi:hypothetical protein